MAAAVVRCGSARGATEVAEVNGARTGFCCRSGAVGAIKTAEVNGTRAGFWRSNPETSVPYRDYMRKFDRLGLAIYLP